MAFITRVSLLSGVRRGDEVRWKDFYETYKPLVYLRANDLHLNETEKEELVQLVMTDFFDRSKTFVYDKSKGRFRDYLKRIITHKAYDLMRKRKDGTVSMETATSEVENISAEAEDHWQKEWENHILRMATNELREEVSPIVFQVFALLERQKKSVQQVATGLGITPDAVYSCKHKALKKLQSIIKKIDD